MSYSPRDYRDTEVHVHRAGAIGDQHVPTLAIYAHDETPDLPLDDARVLYDREATQIADALFDHLPGGVVDRILVRLLERQASLLRVPAPTVLFTQAELEAREANGHAR